jgi:hypothetical protein
MQFYRRGERFKGQWKHDVREGKGTLWSSTSTKYVGNFRQDKKHGQGVITTSKGTVYKEEWNNGILISHIKVDKPEDLEKKQKDRDFKL